METRAVRHRRPITRPSAGFAPRARRRLRALGWTLVLLALLALAAWDRMPSRRDGVVTRVVDGDSLELRVDGAVARVRLRGIDAPEYRQSCRDAAGRDWPCGREARRALAEMAPPGAPLACAVQAADRHGRLLATCRTPSGMDLAARQVRRGWAVALGEDFAGEDLGGEEAAAQADRAGIWRGDFTRPADWRAAQQAAR